MMRSSPENKMNFSSVPEPQIPELTDLDRSNNFLNVSRKSLSTKRMELDPITPTRVYRYIQWSAGRRAYSSTRP
jgi:hypothetical protein